MLAVFSTDQVEQVIEHELLPALGESSGKIVLCASGGVSSPIMLAVAGTITPLSRPFTATAPTQPVADGEWAAP